jgi:hypothetical protein
MRIAYPDVNRDLNKTSHSRRVFIPINQYRNVSKQKFVKRLSRSIRYLTKKPPIYEVFFLLGFSIDTCRAKESFFFKKKARYKNTTKLKK